MSQLQSWEWEFTHSFQSKHNRLLASEWGLWTYYKPMISLFAYHADIAHWNVYIYIYIHTMYTHTYTHRHILASVCAHVYILGLHTDEMTKLQNCLGVSHSKYQRTIVFIKEPPSSLRACTLGTMRHHAHFTELLKNLWLTSQAQRAQPR